MIKAIEHVFLIAIKVFSIAYSPNEGDRVPLFLSLLFVAPHTKNAASKQPHSKYLSWYAG